MAARKMTDVQLSDHLKPLMLRDLRTQCRARGINPGGSAEALRERLMENMQNTGDFEIKPEGSLGQAQPTNSEAACNTNFSNGLNSHNNNYARSGGQNVGNFLTDRPSSRVLAPPGGGSQIVFGDEPSCYAKVSSTKNPQSNLCVAVRYLRCSGGPQPTILLHSKVWSLWVL
jgi:SPIRAL1-like protein